MRGFKPFPIGKLEFPDLKMSANKFVLISTQELQAEIDRRNSEEGRRAAVEKVAENVSSINQLIAETAQLAKEFRLEFSIDNGRNDAISFYGDGNYWVGWNPSNC